MNPRRKTMRLAIAAVAIAIFAALVPACAASEETSEVEQVIERLQADFIDRDDVSDEELRQAAVQGILDYIDDPYTAYLSPERHQAFLESLRGEPSDFEGIGASITYEDNHIVILGPLPGSPAERAGLLPGDVVLAVGGNSTRGLTLEETVAMIRGPKGAEVVLTVSRAGASLPFDIPIVRDTISLSSVLPRLQGEGIGYIRLVGFDAATPEAFPAAIADLRADGAEGLILDLRNNGGGLVEAAIAVVSEFVEAGEVVRWVDAAGEETVESVTGEGTAYDMPLVVIVNGYSASASEIVVGALQDHERAPAVGARTYGKGSVNLLHSLDSGAGLYITIARWLTPNGREIEGEGLDPDIQVGDSLDVQALARIGELSRALCRAYSAETGSLGGQERLVESLDSLCNIEPDAPEPPSSDEQLAAAVAEIERMLGR